MTAQDSRYADWKAPSEDGQFTIWPEPPRLLHETLANQKLLTGAQAVRIQNIPLPELRRREREWIGHRDSARPLIATGHQTELYHPGVWVKDVLINAVAAKLQGQAYHFAVDTDSPKHLHLRWPYYSRPITDDPSLATAPWSGLLALPAPAHIDALLADLAAAQREWAFRPMAGEFLAKLKQLTDRSGNLATALTEAMHQVDCELGLHHRAMVTSPMWHSPVYLIFVHHILARADEFAATYNQALAEYRTAHRLRTVARPWPDLRVTPDECEAPFWLDCPGKRTRARATVSRNDNGWELVAESERFRFDPHADGWSAADALAQFLRETGIVLAPRALTLTGFLRLFVADQFVHGIGGGRYDQVTDAVIARHFGLEPPCFSVTTATLYFPSAVGMAPVNLDALRQEGRRLRHGLQDPQKMEYVGRIASAPRRSRQRQELFFDMHRHLGAQSRSTPIIEWEHGLAAANRLAEERRVLCDRELFYALQPQDRLLMLIQQCSL